MRKAICTVGLLVRNPARPLNALVYSKHVGTKNYKTVADPQEQGGNDPGSVKIGEENKGCQRHQASGNAIPRSTTVKGCLPGSMHSYILNKRSLFFVALI